MKHYNKKYFDWQKSSGEFGAIADLFKFKQYIKRSDRVIEFGCGGAFLLAKIECTEKIGIEINPSARQQAIDNGIKTVELSSAISDEWGDIVISNHALEHCFRPLDEIMLLKSKIKKGGLAVFVLPLEIKNSYKVDDINQHLYTWSPQNIGNLFKVAGYDIIRVETIRHRWPPYSTRIYKYFGYNIFNFVCKIYSRFKGDLFQVRIVAKKA